MSNLTKRMLASLAISALLITAAIYQFFYPFVTYTVVVPADIPEVITEYGKDIRDKYQIKARDYYKSAHRDGWDECIQDYKNGLFPDITRAYANGRNWA